MQSVNALSFAPDISDWLVNSNQPRILHVFDHVCNLINERREVLSIVTPQIENGPFNLVVENDVLFSEHLHDQSTISIRANELTLGDLTIHTADGELWSPRPDWEALHARCDDILSQLTKLPITNYQSQVSLRSVQSSNSLISSLANADLPSSLTATQKLAGLGIGLTPAGDDFILGTVLAAWIIHPSEVARVLAEEITNTAAPLTTSLSAAWLRSAGKGEAGILWHIFFDALISADLVHIQEALDKILAVGETSGADALAGFISTMMCWAQLASSKLPYFSS